MAISSPLLDVSMEGARGVLFNITGGGDLTLNEISEAADIIGKAADPEANVIFGAVIDPSMGNEVKITLIATGFDQPQQGYGPRGGQRRPPDLDDEPARPFRPRRPFGGEPGEASPFDDDESELDIPPFVRRQRRQQR